LKTLLQDKDEQVIEAASNALKEIEDRNKKEEIIESPVLPPS